MSNLPVLRKLPESRPRMVALSCMIRQGEVAYRAPHLLKFDHPNRLGDLEPEAFELRLDGRLDTENQAAVAALFRASDDRRPVTIYVEVD